MCDYMQGNPSDGGMTISLVQFACFDQTSHSPSDLGKFNRPMASANLSGLVPGLQGSDLYLFEVLQNAVGAPGIPQDDATRN